MSDILKLCKDCRWIQPREDGSQPLCGHSTSMSAAEVSLVTGDMKPQQRWTCADMRYFLARGNYCGREGRHWERRL